MSSLALALVLAPAAISQVTSRADEILAERKKKAQDLKPEVPSDAEAKMNRYLTRRSMSSFSIGAYGWSAKLGGAATGQGFAIGPEYRRVDLANGNLNFLVNYQITTKGSTRSELAVALPRLANQRMLVDFSARRHNYNQVDYYGPGPDSSFDGRSNYRYEDMGFDSRVQFKLAKSFLFAPTVGGLLVNVGPGRNDDVISTEKQYTPEQTPGIDRQTDFLRAGGYAGFDWRDSPFGARSGGVYGAVYDFYKDMDLKRHDFHMLKLRAEQYLPYHNKRRVIALRAQSILTWARNDQAVPFYLQPVLGGSEDLRGFRPYRFYGDNSVLLNAEYRWEVFSGMDAALFGDAGKVFNDKANLNFKSLATTVGFGFRFNIQNATFLRLDVGFSREGVMFWMKFNDVFVKKPAGRSAPEHIF